MTCRDVTTTSQTRNFESGAAILNPKPAADIQLHTADNDVTKKHDFVLRNILRQNKHTKVKNYLLTNEGGKREKRLKKDRK